MRQLDAEPLRRPEDRLACANVDLAIVDREGLRRRAVALAGDRIGRALVRDMRLTVVLGRAAGRAFLVVAVAGRLLCVRRRSSGCILSITNSPAAWSVRRGNISTRRTADSAPPGRGRRSRRRASASTARSAASDSTGPRSISLTAFSVPTRQGVHWPQLSSSKNFIRLSATAFISSLSDRITTACDPTKQPYFSSVPKSSGRSAMQAGRMPPDAPPGR